MPINADFWVANKNDIYLAVGLLVFLAIELKLKPVKRYKDHRAKFFFGREIWSWAMMSSAFCAWMFLTLYFFVSFNTNITLLRLFNITPDNPNGTGHWFAWLAIAIVFTRYGWKNMLAGASHASFFASIHELIWYGAYFIGNPFLFVDVFPFYSPFIFDLILFVFAYFLLKRNGSIGGFPANRVILGIAVTIALDAMWVLAGFHITVDLGLREMTQYGIDLDVNLNENSGWLALAVILIWPEKSPFKGLRRNLTTKYVTQDNHARNDGKAPVDDPGRIEEVQPVIFPRVWQDRANGVDELLIACTQARDCTHQPGEKEQHDVNPVSLSPIH